MSDNDSQVVFTLVTAANGVDHAQTNPSQTYIFFFGNLSGIKLQSNRTSRTPETHDVLY